MIVSDDMGYNEIGYHSTYMSWSTPHIDELSHTQGVRLSNYWTHE
jgi:hypothetical protein